MVKDFAWSLADTAARLTVVRLRLVYCRRYLGVIGQVPYSGRVSFARDCFSYVLFPRGSHTVTQARKADDAAVNKLLAELTTQRIELVRRWQQLCSKHLCDVPIPDLKNICGGDGPV